MTPNEALQKIRSACAKHDVPVSYFGAVFLNDNGIEGRLTNCRSLKFPTQQKICAGLEQMEELAARRRKNKRLQTKKHREAGEPIMAPRVIEMALAGNKPADIAAELNLTVEYVRTVLSREFGNTSHQDQIHREIMRRGSDELRDRHLALLLRRPKADMQVRGRI